MIPLFESFQELVDCGFEIVFHFLCEFAGSLEGLEDGIAVELLDVVEEFFLEVGDTSDWERINISSNSRVEY